MRILKASTLIEVMVASILFITLFAIGLEIVTRVTASSPSAEWYIEAGNRHRIVAMECRAGFFPLGETVQHYGNCKAAVTIYTYKNFKNLLEVRIKIEEGGRQLEYRHIITNEISGL